MISPGIGEGVWFRVGTETGLDCVSTACTCGGLVSDDGSRDGTVRWAARAKTDCGYPVVGSRDALHLKYTIICTQKIPRFHRFSGPDETGALFPSLSLIVEEEWGLI
ncbi:hypothetical protein VTK56DRAFT_557 [Thermocarpiscus australiensis]